MLFPSFFLGGFECSTHRLRKGRRLDLASATAHDRFAAQDYELLREAGILAARDGIRWHLIEAEPGRYDFSSLLPMLRAARNVGVLVIWDLLHFGWPDHQDVWSAGFPDHFAKFARAFARVHLEETDGPLYIAPVNEPSFLSFAGGQEGFLNPFATERGNEFKMQLVRASIAAIEGVWSIGPARIVHCDPLINIQAESTRPQDRAEAEAYRQSQFAGWDMLAGRLHSQLGGDPKYLDILGINYYAQNQWIHNPFGRDSVILSPSHPQHLPLRYMLREVHERYGRPLFVAETGIEDEARPTWLRYVGNEVAAAIGLSVPLEGICLYPILNHPGWEDDRHCHNGLWDYADARGRREIHEPLARELNHQQTVFKDLFGQDGGATHLRELSARETSAA